MRDPVGLHEGAPVHRMWGDDGFNASDYDSILVVPVNMAHVLDEHCERRY